MERKILIDCYKVYDTGAFYTKEADTIEQNQTELTEISDTIEELWQGGDSHNFLVSFRQHIEDMNEIIGFLDEKSEILRGVSKDHKTNDENFTLKMKRSDEDDEQFKY